MQLKSLFWILAGSAVAAATVADYYPDHEDHDDHYPEKYPDKYPEDPKYPEYPDKYPDHHDDHHGGYHTMDHDGYPHHHKNHTTVTSIVTALTTYCPKPTTLTHGTRTYTITKATTLTILDCPCTLTKTIPIVHPTHCVGEECPKPPPCKGKDCPCEGEHCHTRTHYPTQPPVTHTQGPPPIVTAAAGRVQEGIAGVAVAIGAVALAAL